MNIIEITNVDDALVDQIVGVWESSVRATHLFLSQEEIEDIKKYVPQAIMEVPHLMVIKDDNDSLMGFMAIAQRRLEMLFIAQEGRGHGYGKYLLQYGISHYSIHDLAVNEQNPLARGFYEHMGFQVYKRTKNDEQGNPYPLLYMKRKDSTV